MWQTLGHAPAKQLLDKQLQARKFPHAYLFVGPNGVGKKTLAQEMAGRILETQSAVSHADFIYYDAGTGEGMDGLRQFLPRLTGKPFVGQYKVAIIDNMDQANAQMGNALLKTLEEPSPSTILFVIASQNNLLPTIVSRCQGLSFNGLSDTELTEYARAGNLEATQAILSASFGSPVRLQTLVENPELTLQVETAIKQLETASASGTAEKLLAINTLAEFETDQLKDILLTWLYQQRQLLTTQPGRGKIVSGICEALTHLNGSFNKKMVLQRLLLQTYETA